MNLAGQLLESVLRDSGSRRQQQGFEQRIARAQTFGGRTDGPLVRGQADTGERSAVTPHFQLNTARRVIKSAAEKRVIDRLDQIFELAELVQVPSPQKDRRIGAAEQSGYQSTDKSIFEIFIEIGVVADLRNPTDQNARLGCRLR